MNQSPWMTRREAGAYLRWSVDTVDRNLVPMADGPREGKLRYQVQKHETRRVRIWAEDVYAVCPLPARQEQEAC